METLMRLTQDPRTFKIHSVLDASFRATIGPAAPIVSSVGHASVGATLRETASPRPNTTHPQDPTQQPVWRLSFLGKTALFPRL